MALQRSPSNAHTLIAPLRRLCSLLRLMVPALLALLTGLNMSLAQQATPSPRPEIGRTEEVICSGTIPAAYQPAGDAFLDVGRAILEPGIELTWTADDLTPSTAFDCVISGSYSLVIDGEVEVVRGSTGERESYLPNTEVRATAGDTVYLLQNDRNQTYVATGDEPLVVVSVALFQAGAPACVAAGTCTSYPETIDSEWLGGMGPTEWARTRLEGQDFVATVRQVTLESDGVFVVTADNPATTWFVVDGPVRWVSNGNRMLSFTMQRGQPIIFVPLSGTNTIEIRNDEADPAVLIEIEVAPAAPTSATPSP